MTDTVVITLPETQFYIKPSYYERFTPSVKHFFIPPYASFGFSKYLKAVCNPSDDDKAKGIYLPRLTLIRAVRKGGIGNFLSVEFSAQKILFNNNFDEPDNDDIGLLCDTLKEKLAYYGVMVYKTEYLANASVKAIHYAKNLVLTDFSTPSYLFEQLRKVDLSGWKDLEDDKYNKFRNSGDGVKFHTNACELTFYDKLKEYNRAKISEKRTYEKDNYCQISLFENENIKRLSQIVRMESRYGNKKEIRKILENCGINDCSDLTLKQLYSQRISKQVLIYELTQMKTRYPKVLFTENRLEKLFVNLLFNNPRAKIRDIMLVIGYKALLSELGCREVRAFGNLSAQDWYKFKSKIKKMKFSTTGLDCFTILEKQLQEFVPVKVIDYLNNDNK